MDNTFQKMNMLTIYFIEFLKDLITFYFNKIRTITHKNKLKITNSLSHSIRVGLCRNEDRGSSERMRTLLMV